MDTYHNPVIPCENRQFVKSSNKVPPRGNVARYEDTESEDGKWVHEFSSFKRATFSAFALQIARIAEAQEGVIQVSRKDRTPRAHYGE